jgi:2-amino-4-hydroxy-6-hydroxymethyldihydropteridine diphosphokinase
MRSRSRCGVNALDTSKKQKHIVYISLGSNLGDRQMFIAYAIRRLNHLEKTRFVTVSGLYASEPVGIADRTPFLNMAVEIKTRLDAESLLESLQTIEKDAGRTNKQRNTSRVLDMDILFYDDDIIERDNLIVPHPEIHNRRFVLEPLADIAGDYVHPVKEKTIKELLDSCRDNHWVSRVGERFSIPLKRI